MIAQEKLQEWKCRRRRDVYEQLPIGDVVLLMSRLQVHVNAISEGSDGFDLQTFDVLSVALTENWRMRSAGSAPSGEITYLELLSTQHLVFDVGPRFLSLVLRKLGGTADVPTTDAGGDQVSDTGTLEHDLVAVLAEEFVGEFADLVESQPHDGSLSVRSEPQTVTETGGNGNDVLDGAEHLDSGNTGYAVDLEVRPVEELLEDEGVLLFLVSNGGLTELFLGDVGGNVGTGKGEAWDTKLLLDGLGEAHHIASGKLDTLDETDADGTRLDGTHFLHLPNGGLDELVREHNDEGVRLLDALLHVRYTDQVVRQLDSRQVLLVLVVRVDDLAELAALEDFLEHPQAYSVVEFGVSRSVLRNEFARSRSPVAAAHNTNLHRGEMVTWTGHVAVMPLESRQQCNVPSSAMPLF
ncbi:SCY1 2, putative [Babesia ovata]|uniref:SCY1 2, putative n=1 Tax=Babesia ovata TaxID=189622 RepID=A0A2H6K9W5_9APIC|nr:SCY1 2, putative [Babesia ovata]GBE59783.1 SCY1 2, putative [Babesia ovata]